MKATFFTLLFSMLALCGYSQVLIDNGPLIDPALKNSRFVIQGSKWNKTSLKYCICNTSSKISATVQNTAIRAAFNMWQESSNLSFTQVNNASDADLKLSWVTGNHGDGEENTFNGPEGELAHAFYPLPAGGRYAGEIHFDDDENWTENFLRIVAAHEIGHSLGLGHSTDLTALMFPEYSQQRNRLMVDDLEGIWNLYGCYISGPSGFCEGSSATFTLDKCPPHIPINWSVSSEVSIVSIAGNTIQVTSNSGILPIGSIFAQVGSYRSVKNIQVGMADVTQITGSKTARIGSKQVYLFQGDPYDSNFSELVWEVVPSRGANVTVSANQLNVTFTAVGSYTLRCYLKTLCGIGGAAYFGVSAGYNYAVSMNDHTITIQQESSTLKQREICSYQLINTSTGSVMSNGKLSSEATNIDKSNLGKGIYILKLQLPNGDFENHKIVL